MYLHLGRGTVVRSADIVAVCDIDNTSWSGRTREFLAAAERSGSVINAAEDIPKSFVLCCENGRQTVYLSQLAPATLSKRAEAPMAL